MEDARRVAILTTMIYLHIGVSKTASTTIQKNLWENKAQLLKAGWLYPDAGIVGFAHHNLFREITQVSEYNDQFSPAAGSWDDVRSEIEASGATRVIISCENFSSFQRQHIVQLKRALSMYDVRIIVYLRRQDEFIYSSWAQEVKLMIVAMQLAQWIEERQKLSSETVLPNYDHLLEKWAKSFRKAALIVRIFEKSSIKGHIFEDFLSACGVADASSYPISNSENITPDPRTLEIIRALNASLGLYKQPRYRSLGHAIGSAIVDFYQTSEGIKGKPGNSMDDETAKRILAHFEKANRSVAREYLGRDSLFEAFANKPRSPQTGLEVSKKEGLQLTGYVLRRLYKSFIRK